MPSGRLTVVDVDSELGSPGAQLTLMLLADTLVPGIAAGEETLLRNFLSHAAAVGVVDLMIGYAAVLMNGHFQRKPIDVTHPAMMILAGVMPNVGRFHAILLSVLEEKLSLHQVKR